jgi:hypothetical protein
MEPLKFYDKQNATRTKESVKFFVEQINEWVLEAHESAGLEVTNKNLFDFLEKPQNIKEELIKQAKKEGKQTVFKQKREELIQTAESTADKLIRGLNKVFTLNYSVDENPRHDWEQRIIFELKKYIKVDNQLISLQSGWETVVDDYFTYTPDKLGAELYSKLQKTLDAISELNNWCIENNLDDFKLKLPTTNTGSINHPLLGDMEVLTKELCTLNFEAIAERKRQITENSKKSQEDFKKEQERLAKLRKQKPKDTRYSETLTTGKGRDIAT